MAKKSRRVRRKGQQVRLSAAQMVRPASPAAAGALTGAAEAAERAAVAAPRAPRLADLREEYRYVIADLKRIGIIAAAMLVVLVVLALVLT